MTQLYVLGAVDNLSESEMSSRQVGPGCEPRQGRAGVGDIFTHFIHLGEGEAFLSHRIRVLCYNLDQRPAKSIDGHLGQKFTEPL